MLWLGQIVTISHLLMSPSNRSTAVARGAVLRALRKEDGPARILESSYGFVRTELYGTQEAHSTQTPKRDKIDGFDYIDDTIEWIINKVETPFFLSHRAIRTSFATNSVQKGDTLVSENVFKRKVEYTFALRKKRLLCTEALYVSDHRHESHYRIGHPKNDG
jgi:hypothetical protein